MREMVVTDFKIRYQSSVLGYLWSLLKPLFIFTILYVVFTQVFRFGDDVPHFPVYLLLGIVLWNFFAETTSTGVTSVVAQGDLIRKISIPRYLPVIASSMSALINLVLNMIVVVIFAFINGVFPTLEWLLLPVLVVELYAFSLSVSFLLSALYVKFRDINYVWEVIMQAGFYATPIIYPLSFIDDGSLHKWFFINPMAQIIQDARYFMVTDHTVTLWGSAHGLFVLVPFAIILLLAILATLYFKAQSRYFAENL